MVKHSAYMHIPTYIHTYIQMYIHILLYIFTYIYTYRLELPDSITMILQEGAKWSNIVRTWTPSLWQALKDYKILRNNIHVYLGFIIVYIFGNIGWDVGFILPVFLIMYRLESIHMYKVTSKAIARLDPNEDPRVTAMRVWQNLHVPEEEQVCMYACI